MEDSKNNLKGEEEVSTTTHTDEDSESLNDITMKT